MSLRLNEKRLCIAYAAGPGDVVKTFSYWQKGMDDLNQTSVTYSSLFFDVCKNINARGVAISSCTRVDSIRTEQFLVTNMPKGKEKKGIAFHLQQIRYVRKIIRIAATEGADILVMADATGHFFPYIWFAPLRLKFVPSLHCNLWSRFMPLSPLQKIINKLNAYIFTQTATAILSVSPSINAQIAKITNNNSRPIYRFYQLYRKTLFDSIAPPNLSSDCFNLLFVGRLETEKGVFDLLQIAEQLMQQEKSKVIIHLCGNGSCENELRKATKEKELEESFIIHGFCCQDEMVRHINASHAFIVPTKSTFEEGYNKVVVEALLSGRPVITSSVCVYPDLEKLSEAVVEVPPDDIKGYISAIQRLASDKQYYLEKTANSHNEQEKFYASSFSWRAALEKIIIDAQLECP